MPTLALGFIGKAEVAKPHILRDGNSWEKHLSEDFPKKNFFSQSLLVNFSGIQWQRIQVAQLKSTQKSSFIFIDHIFVRWRAKQGSSGQKFSLLIQTLHACYRTARVSCMSSKVCPLPPPTPPAWKNLKVRLLLREGERTLLTPKGRLARLRFRLLKVFLLVCCLLSLQKKKKKIPHAQECNLSLDANCQPCHLHHHGSIPRHTHNLVTEGSLAARFSGACTTLQ